MRFSPPSDFAIAGNLSDQSLGRALFAQGKLAVVVLAGGEGSRLGFPGPKGAFPISVVHKKSLFQLLSEKICARSLALQKEIPLAVMTSPDNDAATKRFFADNHSFGLSAQQLDFFCQRRLPLLDSQAEPLRDEKGELILAANGNGEALQQLVASGIFQKWKERGVEYLFIVPVDNPLADPCDEELLGFHVRQSAEATIKATTRRDAQEKVGVVTLCNGQLRIVEYSELPEEIAENFSLANTGLFAFSMSFVERLAQENLSLPIHLAAKSRAGKKVMKQETFLFDLLPFAKKCALLVYPREEVFAPLKNREGLDSVAEVQRALEAHDRKLFAQREGQPPPAGPFELDPFSC